MRVLAWGGAHAGAVRGHDLGSRRKVLGVYKALEKEGYRMEEFEHVFAPMGLEIGALSPEEIALSIVAELVAVRLIRIRGRKYVLKLFHAIALFSQRLIYTQHLAAAADHSHVSRPRAHRPGEHSHIFPVSARYDHQIARGIGMQFLKRFIETCENFLSHRKATGIGKSFAVIYHANAKSRGLRRFRYGHGDMAPAE